MLLAQFDSRLAAAELQRMQEQKRKAQEERLALDRAIGNMKKSTDDALHEVLCAAGYNIRWLLRMIAKKDLGLLFCLLQTSGLANLLEKLAEILGRNRL